MRVNPTCMRLSERLDVCLSVLKVEQLRFCLKKATPVVAPATHCLEEHELFERAWIFGNTARVEDSKARAIKAGRKRC